MDFPYNSSSNTDRLTDRVKTREKGLCEAETVKVIKKDSMSHQESENANGAQISGNANEGYIFPNLC